MRVATLKSLLAKGYLPRELPPPFTSVTFARHATAAAAKWNFKTWTRCVAHNLARPGGLRRPLKIPNPFSHYHLADVIASNWSSITQFVFSQRLSASRPYIPRTSTRAVIPRYAYSELGRLRALRRRAARYLVVSDIDQFYPSIYTHAIPWALHGKAVAKAAAKAKGGPPLLGDLLDRALQYMSDGQTYGIPIGPDTSLIVAELLLTAADRDLIATSAARKGFRYVDDYELSFTTLSDAEQCLSDLQAVLASLELLLNPRKTRIVDLPIELDTTWAVQLKKMTIRDRKRRVAQRNDILDLFSRAFELAGQHGSDAVLRYAVASVQGLDVHAAAWRSFHNCVLGAAAADPSTLATALGTLFLVSRRGRHSVPITPLAEVLESVVARHAPRAQGSEVAWALWAAVAWNVGLSATAAKMIDQMEDDVVALLALHANAKALFPSGALTGTKWAALVADPNVLNSEHWLLAYEAHQHGWLTTPSIAKDAAFAALSAAKVKFYDEAKSNPQFPIAGRAAPGGKLWLEYA